MEKIFIASLALGLSLFGQETKTASQAYKNITELKDIPADQLVPAMQFIATSLGVQCDTCHVAGKPEADDKRPKKTAREMIAMTMAINKNAFHGQTQVTCYSCHRGSERPVAIPPVIETDAPAKPEGRPAPTVGSTPPTADSIIENYVTAMGGADAMKKITSRVGKGSIAAGGTETPIEVFTKAPNKRITVTHNSNADSFTAFDGTIGWMGTSGRPAREMSPADAVGSALDSEFYLPLRIKEIFTQLRPGRPDKIGDVPVLTLTGTRQGLPPVRFFFDANSGLLLRMVRYTENPLGRMPVQIDYADYREVDRVKTPFRWTLSRPNGRFTIQLTEVKANVPIDDAKFAKPAADSK
ncbi:MAG TPA: c-type cytochrome [Bryobacteraceae bacterium]|nr:c-type cytochrome [Bryobacteraceae bacterium]